MAFGGPRSSCVRPGAHSALRQDSRKDWTPCCMALHVVSAGAHAPHSDETLGPTATRGSSHSARRLRSLASPCSSRDGKPRVDDERKNRQLGQLTRRKVDDENQVPSGPVAAGPGFGGQVTASTRPLVSLESNALRRRLGQCFLSVLATALIGSRLLTS